MSIKKLFIISIVWTISLFLTWCWKEEIINVDFEDFQISLNNDFKEFNSNNIDSESNVEKIIKSLKRKNDNWYVENIIISKSSNQNNLDSQTFASANIDKIKKEVIGYKNIQSNSFDFSCNWDKIQVIRNYFGINDNIFDDKSQTKYYVQQYYYIYNNYSYIISYTSDNKDNIELIDWYVKDIKCK